jgi:hypothetical protein
MSYFPVQNGQCMVGQAVSPYPSYGEPAVGASWHSLEVKTHNFLTFFLFSFKLCPLGEEALVVDQRSRRKFSIFVIHPFYSLIHFNNLSIFITSILTRILLIMMALPKWPVWVLLTYFTFCCCIWSATKTHKSNLHTFCTFTFILKEQNYCLWLMYHVQKLCSVAYAANARLVPQGVLLA